MAPRSLLPSQSRLQSRGSLSLVTLPQGSAPPMTPVRCRCPLCFGVDTFAIGPVFHPTPAMVAGVSIDLGNTDYELIRCRDCGFWFKHPPIPENSLLDCYARSSGANWGAAPDPHQRQFDILRDLVVTYAKGRRVLDVGCSNGALLEYLGPEWELNGVEPSEDAANWARTRGITVLSPTIDSLPRGHSFDVILAIDVIEHISSPMEFLVAARHLLKDDGVLVLLTGNTGSLPWRVCGNRYWYCSLPEHVSFFCERAMRSLAARLGMLYEAHYAISHIRAHSLLRIRQMLKNAVFWTGTKIRWCGVTPWRKAFGRRSAPDWISAKDHSIHVLRRVVACIADHVSS